MLLPEVRHLEHLRLEALAAALVARHEHVGHEHHLDLEIARALARLAAPAGDVEAEGAGGVAALPRSGSVGEDAPDLVVRLHVRHRVRARRAADRALVDEHHVVERLAAGERCRTRRRVSPRCCLAECSPVSLRLERAIQHVVHERALARARHAGDRGHRAERDAEVDALEVVLARAGERRATAARRGRRVSGSGISRAPVRYWPVSGLSATRDIGPAKTTLAALLAARGPELDHVVGGADRLEVVLDDEHRVAAVAQPQQQREQPVHVARVQPDRRLVEHVQRVDELRAERVGEADALRLAARQRARRAVEREVGEPDVAEEAHAVPRFAQDVRRDLAARTP